MDDNPDYPALVIGNFILGGGGLSSRIANRLRQKDGQLNGAIILGASPLDPRADLVLNAIYNPVNVAKVVSDVDEELLRAAQRRCHGLRAQGAKNGYLQQQNDIAHERYGNYRCLIGKSVRGADNAVRGRSLEQKIKDLTPETVNAALRKYVDPKRLSVVTAGDFKK